MVRTPCFLCKGHGFISDWTARIPHDTQGAAKNKTETNDIKNRKSTDKINYTKSWFSENMNKVVNFLTRLRWTHYLSEMKVWSSLPSKYLASIWK